MPKSLEEMSKEVFDNNMAHGWFEASRTFGDETALLHSEVSEAFEAYREIGMAGRTRVAEPNEDGLIIGKPDDVASELADVLIRLFDVTYRYGIDLEVEYERKMAYNRTRPIRHGGKKL